jgi:hypothetical protein
VGEDRREHDPDGGEQRQRAGAKSDERQSEQEQHPVVGEDYRQTTVQGGEHQAEHGDQQGPQRQAHRPERPLRAVDGLARPGHQREADPSKHREQRRRPAAGQPLAEGQVTFGRELREHVRGDHAQQRQAAGHVESHQPAWPHRPRRGSAGFVGRVRPWSASILNHSCTLARLGLQGSGQPSLSESGHCRSDLLLGTSRSA